MLRSLVFIFGLFFWQGVFGQTFNLNKQINGFGQIPNQIYSLGQDAKGFVWITTNRGTQFSDGIIKSELPDSIKSQLINPQKVLIDEEGEVWVFQSSNRPKVFHFNHNRWKELPINLPGDLDSGKFEQIGLFVRGIGKNKLVQLILPELILQFGESDGDYLQQEPIIHDLGELYQTFITEEDSLFLFEKGIYTLEKGRFSKINHALSEEGIKVVKIAYVEHLNKYYFLTDRGLFEGDTINDIPLLIFEHFGNPFANGIDVYDMFINGDDLYFYYNSQLYQFNMVNHRGVEISAYRDLKARQISAAMVDREGAIWLGTFRGLANLASLKFQNFDSSNGIANPDVSALILVKRHQYLIGFENGIQLWVGAKPVKTIFFSEKDDPKKEEKVLNFAKDLNGNIWFSAYQLGLGFFNPFSYKTELITLPEGEPVTYVMVEDNDIWAVGFNKVYHAKLPQPGQRPVFQLFEMGFATDKFQGFIRKIGKLSNGQWVIATNGKGLENENFERFGNAIAFSGFDFIEKNDTLFLGREQGLYFMEGDKPIKVKFKGQPVDHPVYSILEDENKNTWLGTDSGVFLWDKTSLRHFNESNGLLGNDVARGALAQGDMGRVMVGTQNGVSVYIPKDDKGSPASPPVILEKISISDVEEVEFNPLNIPYQLNNIVCTFSAASFTKSPGLVIEYQLEGYHSDWETLVNPQSNMLYFNNLPPGEYRLAIRSILFGNAPSETVYSSFFQVEHPFYLQFWFILLVFIFLILLGAIINIIFRQSKNQGLLRNSINEKTFEIKSREDQFKNVWNSSQDGLMLSVIGGKVIAANPTLCRMAGVNEEELKNKGLAHLFKNPDFYEKVRNTIAEDLDRIEDIGYTTEFNMPFRKGDLDIELYISRMKEEFEGKPFYLSVFRDISKIKAYEQGLTYAKEKAEEASKLKSSIISNMSHEVRTPLNGILGSTENIILARDNDKELVGQLNIIKESGERLLNTMNNILDLSLMESDKMNMVLENTNVNDFISKILVNHKSIGIKKGILVSAKFQTKPFFAPVERKYLEMIVNNIVGNAVKYSEKGMVQVLVQQKEEDLFFQVKDEGIGIGKDHIEKLFYPFEQESKGFDRKFEGSGIGLAITKHVVELLCGKINIDSEKGSGTTVTISLPIKG